jgi:hypothetical protein
MTTESERPPRIVNGKRNPVYEKWVAQRAAAKITKTCGCGCGALVKTKRNEYVSGHQWLVPSNKEKWDKINTSTDLKKKRIKTHQSKGCSHGRAKNWCLKSPDNATYTFKNVGHFVRTHAHLFHPDDTIIKYRKGTLMGHCNAINGLLSLSPRQKNPKGTWKGWRIDSQQERLFHEGKTLLEDISPLPTSSNTTRETPPR